VTAPDPALADEAFCYLTTTGRVTGKPREIEIWFGLNGRTLYLLSGGRERSDWVRNLQKAPDVSVRIAGRTFAGRARIVPHDSGRTPSREGSCSRSTGPGIRGAYRTGGRTRCRWRSISQRVDGLTGW
jgi:deazaflavin-dependent oxidoreductase (nitroreductase family)